jgi:hypothetical protein
MQWHSEEGWGRWRVLRSAKGDKINALAKIKIRMQDKITT